MVIQIIKMFKINMNKIVSNSNKIKSIINTKKYLKKKLFTKKIKINEKKNNVIYFKKENKSYFKKFDKIIELNIINRREIIRNMKTL